MKIRPWPFGEDIVYLHWIGNVKMKNNQWYIRVAFVNNNELKVIELPIGILPTLKIGVPYIDGLPLYTQKEGTYTNFLVKNLSQGTTKKAIDICRKFNIFLYKSPELMNQKIWSYTANQMTFHIPHTEIIRGLFAPNKTIANVLLRPNGLDYLVNQSDFLNNGHTLYIDFADEIPGSIINDDFAKYFSWLYFNNLIKKSFESIQSNAYSYGLKRGSLFGIPLEINPPLTDQTQIAARGIHKDEEFLVLEILGIDNIIPPFYELQYRHKSIKKYVYTEKPKKKRLSKQENQEDYILNEKDGERSREDTNQPAIELEPIQIAFRHSTVVKRIPKKEQKVNQGDEYVSNVGRGGGIKQQVVGLDESLFGGNITPLEFKSIEVVKTIAGYKFESFIRMIKILSNHFLNLSFSMNIVFLPFNRSFSFLPNGMRRAALIVKINNNGKINYIIEASAPDNHSLSTLIVPSLGSQEKDEKMIRTLLNNLVYASGRWKKDFLGEFSHIKLKHLKQTHETWAKRLYKCL